MFLCYFCAIFHVDFLVFHVNILVSVVRRPTIKNNVRYMKMLKVATEPLELRGIASNTSKKGTNYYTINCESEDGTPYALYCPDFNALPQGLSKGDKIRVYCNVKVFNRQERLEVCHVEKVK